MPLEQPYLAHYKPALQGVFLAFANAGETAWITKSCFDVRQEAGMVCLLYCFCARPVSAMESGAEARACALQGMVQIFNVAAISLVLFTW